MEYMEYDDFRHSVTTLYRQGGPFKKAAEKVFAIRDKAFGGMEFKEVFDLAKTHEGENRIPHCVKYDLPGRARLVTMVNNDICMLLFAGAHDDAHEWLNRNRKIDFIAKKQGNAQVIEPVFKSSTNPSDLIRTGTDLAAPDCLLDLISGRYRDRLLEGLPEEVCRVMEEIGPMAPDSELLAIVDAIVDEARRTTVLDVLLKLRESDAVGAKNRIDLHFGEVKHLDELTKKETAELQSGERVIKVTDVDPQLFEHFVKTAGFQKWMLYLHPNQREYVDRDHHGTMRVSGISGSGKTSVLIHRAMRLAETYPKGKVLVLTLNAALAKLIDSLIDSSRGKLRPKNLRVSSFWELCREKLVAIEPQNKKLYTQTTIATNPYAVSEHIDDIWHEYYNCEYNNSNAELMYPLHRSLLARRIFPKDYLKQEFDYVRSAFAPSGRAKNYLAMERTGRAIPLDGAFRTQVIDGLKCWEEKMAFVGAIDATAIATALYRHLDELSSEYRCILIDEVQDFGTLELAIIRRLVAEEENDLFLCGDAAQSVYTKHQDYEAAGINVRGGRSMRLGQNYRNSRQILVAAHDILMSNYERCSKGIVDFEILPPEFANFSSSKPNLLSAPTLREELEYALAYAKGVVDESQHKKVCIAVAGYHQRGVEDLGTRFELPVLNGDINIDQGHVFLADLEQTKGFDFDSMIIVNARSNVLPHPDLPAEESFRDLSKFYVAMTRAKTELIVSYHETVTEFIGENRHNFAVGDWSDYSEKISIGDAELPAPGVAEKKFGVEWELTGKEFLRMPEAVGLPINAQEKLLECVIGKITLEGKKKSQKTWMSIGEFISDMHRPANRIPISLSDEAWHAIATHFGRSSGVMEKSP